VCGGETSTCKAPEVSAKLVETRNGWHTFMHLPGLKGVVASDCSSNAAPAVPVAAAGAHGRDVLTPCGSALASAGAEGAGAYLF